MNRTRTPIETISEKDSIINSKHHYEHFLKEEIVEDDQDANVDDLEGLQCSKIRIRVKESFQKMPIPPDSIQDNLNLLDMINLGSTNTSRSNGGLSRNQRAKIFKSINRQILTSNQLVMMMKIF
eukprot:403340475